MSGADEAKLEIITDHDTYEKTGDPPPRALRATSPAWLSHIGACWILGSVAALFVVGFIIAWLVAINYDQIKSVSEMGLYLGYRIIWLVVLCCLSLAGILHGSILRSRAKIIEVANRHHDEVMEYMKRPS